MTRPIGTTLSFLTVMAIVILLALSGCGKKGDLDPPDGKEDEFPRQYPDPATL